ncbi:DNA repair protein Swi5/Sae3 [Kwoniella heveanensis BCC8398]|uniref:DNA repair protein Swi5/Sae3 n=1 Tax=Kwoniella heveanensis BCC8398 TaxID=1296120 RepID=A0A1B9GR96_9TREE|nr:DNA repair protein Swi5/Sae3 [Kwoniella heveanensis BCC8398]
MTIPAPASPPSATAAAEPATTVPELSAHTSSSSSTSKSTRQEKIRALEKELAQLRAQLGDRDPKEINKNHIELLHTYNEIKDGTQALIGRYAAMNHKTVGQVHVELNLPLTD